ncbi:hypothetical protein SAMN04488528_101834 [Clostridium frigidicarnis]|uniref:Uncharacterized protein n=1 Tax=Clostridium frigidicarnis TaxID=84698 RepID=A0A1I0ZAY1_9CLOT|nr:hypothetical protein SAMN04488528_101834 [Clostridium frigidicarnis]
MKLEKIISYIINDYIVYIKKVSKSNKNLKIISIVLVNDMTNTNTTLNVLQASD